MLVHQIKFFLFGFLSEYPDHFFEIIWWLCGFVIIDFICQNWSIIWFVLLNFPISRVLRQFAFTVISTLAPKPFAAIGRKLQTGMTAFDNLYQGIWLAAPHWGPRYGPCSPKLARPGVQNSGILSKWRLLPGQNGPCQEMAVTCDLTGIFG